MRLLAHVGLLLGLSIALPSATVQKESERRPTVSVETDLVILSVTVVDRRGAVIPGLTAEHFKVYDDGRPQAIEFFTNVDIPATIGLVIDSSSSMRGHREEVTAAATAFAAVSHPRDELFTMNFNEAVWPGLAPPFAFAKDVGQLRAALAQAPARGMTALYENDAVDRSLAHLELGTHDRKVLVVVSDGGDNASSHTLDDVLEYARRTSAVVYAVILVDPDDQDAKPGVLKRLARETGGAAFAPKGAQDMMATFTRIALEIRGGYTLGFSPTDASHGGFRAIRVVVDDADHRSLVARNGEVTMPGLGHTRSSKRGTRVIGWVAALLVIVGAAALTWCAFVLTDGYIVQEHARETLESMPPVTTPSAASPAAPSRLERGAPLAELSVPRIGLSAVVLHGSDAGTLRLGLGHIENTPLPGESGNVAIAGHRDSFFRPLRDVQVGDDILLDTPQAHLHYRVSSFRVVNAHEVSVIAPTRDATLTLVTCYPFWFIGQAPDRFVVRATRVEDPAAVVPPSVAVRTREPNRGSIVGGAPTENDEGVATEHEGRATQSSGVGRVDARAPGEVNPAIQGASTVLAARGANDTDALVREAVEHFRLTYNARLARRGELGADGLLTFAPCDVAVAGGTAIATCDAALRAPERVSSPVWTFTLDRIGAEWTIKSVAMR